MKSIRLAPMCGITDYIFREFCYELGCDLAYTEMISAIGYLNTPKQVALQDLMKRGDHEPKLILQLFGKDPSTVAEAAARLSETGYYNGIDINMGCPAHKIAPSGEGCGLMREPEIAYQMMAKTVHASKLPVSIKMRLGWDDEHKNGIEIAKLAEEAGISEITVHGRTRQQQYSGTADWDEIEKIACSVHIPVIGNGDIFSTDDAMIRMKDTHTSGIMIGRGAMGNPWIFMNIKRRMRGSEEEPVTFSMRKEMIRNHYERMLIWKPQKIAVCEMRKHIGWYLHGIRGASKARAEINRAENPDDVWKIIDRLEETLQENENNGRE